MGKKSTYSFSFTAASLRLNDTVKVAKAAFANGISDFKEVRESGVVFDSVTTQTSMREFREIRNRLEYLTPTQMEILIDGDLISQKQIAFLAVCKYYNFIRDFTIDVLLDKLLVYSYKINESDFNSFINNKIQTHPELEKFAESTLKKAKQVMFLIYEQTGIINNATDKIIQPQLLQPSVVNAISEEDPLWLKIFMMPDKDINLIKH
ncbi:MAG TPA: DUF1819 family protein [Paludibacter sp.]